MKRVLLILFIVLSLLVSCSTTKGNKPETQVEQPEASVAVEVVEEKAEESGSEAVEEPAEEETPAPEEEPAATEEAEQNVAEQEITENESTEVAITETPAEEENPVDEQDWSQVIGAAPSETVEEEILQAEEAAEAPAVVTEEAAVEKTEKPQSSARVSKPSFVDRLTAFIKKIGNFIADQILMSIGIFVCFGGVIYLIVALVVSSRREKRRAGYSGRKPKQDRSESDAFRPESDKDPETDDDFLKSLLGDDND